MPLEPPDKDYFTAAIGYVELGLFLDANAELEKIDPFNRVAPEVLSLKIDIYRGLQKWDLMQEIANRLRERFPGDVQWVISYAYAARRADSIDTARNILINAMPKFPRESIIYYNLACL